MSYDSVATFSSVMAGVGVSSTQWAEVKDAAMARQFPPRGSFPVLINSAKGDRL